MSVTIFQLDQNTCRWPMDLRDEYGIRRFCGHETHGLTYCPPHDRIAHAGIPERKKATVHA